MAAGAFFADPSVSPTPGVYGSVTARPHDALFKDTFSDLDSARGELSSILPQAVGALVDWDTLRLEPGTFVDEALRETMSDLLFSVRIHGREARLYLLFEHQSGPDPLMPFRALRYVVRIWEGWLRHHDGAQRLPPVIPLLLAHVEGGWQSPTELSAILDFADDAERDALADLVPALRILVDDLASVTDAMLDARPMPERARLMLTALREVRGAADVAASLGTWARRIRSLGDGPEGRSALRSLLSYIWYARPAVDIRAIASVVRGIDPRAEETVMTTAQELIQQGEARGEARGRSDTLLRLLRLRFTAIPANVADRIARADIATLDRWVDRVLTASSADEVVAD